MNDSEIKQRLIDRSIEVVMSDGRPDLWYGDGSCQMCGVQHDNSWYNGLVRDHCHITGFFRGYLCGTCNSAEGRNRDFRWIAWRVMAPSLEPGKRTVWQQQTPVTSFKKVPKYLDIVPMAELLDLENIIGFIA